MLVGTITVFFVLTTYFQARKIRRIQSEGKTLNFPKEALRVIWRLFSHIHLVILAVLVWIQARAPISVKELWLDSAWNMTFGLGNWYQASQAQNYWIRDSQLSPVFHLWAMSAQVQIILVLLFVGFLLTLLKVTWPGLVKRVAWVALALITVYLFVQDILNYRLDTAIHLSTWTWLWAFALGVLFAYTDYKFPNNALSRILVDVLFFAVLTLAVLGLFDISIFGVYTKNIMALLVVVPLFTNFSATGTTKLLESKVFQKLAYVAFGVYLWHWAVMQIFKNEFDIEVLNIWQMLLILTLSFALSFVSTFVVDFVSKKLENITSVTQWILKCSLLLAVPAIAFYLSSQDVSLTPNPNPSDSASESFFDPPLALANRDKPDFYDDSKCTAEKDYICTFGNPNGKVHAVLYGSSLAGNWEPALKAIAEKNQWRLDIRIRLGCPDGVDEKRIERSCEIWLERIEKEILETKPDIVFVNMYAIDTSGQVPEAISPDFKRWKTFAKKGIAVFALRGGTEYPGTPLDCLEEKANPIGDCSFIDRFSYLNQAAISDTFKNFPRNFAVIDLKDQFCQGSRCFAALADGTIIYKDPVHLTKTFSLSLVAELEAKIDGYLKIFGNISSPDPEQTQDKHSGWNNLH